MFVSALVKFKKSMNLMSKTLSSNPMIKFLHKQKEYQWDHHVPQLLQSIHVHTMNTYSCKLSKYMNSKVKHMIVHKLLKQSDILITYKFFAVDKNDNESIELVENIIKTIKYFTFHHDMDLKRRKHIWKIKLPWKSPRNYFKRQWHRSYYYCL